MKKIIKTSKKALSVFMAALMIMTAWVFVAPDELKASAVNAGDYYVTVWVRVYDDSNNNYGNNYTNKITDEGVLQNDNDNNCAGFTIYYKGNNGTDSGESFVATDITSDLTNNKGDYSTMPRKKKDTTAYSNNNTDYLNVQNTRNDYCLRKYIVKVGGFPTRVYWGNDHGSAFDESEWCISQIDVGSTSSGGGTTIWKGIAGGCSSTKRKDGTIDPSYCTAGTNQNKDHTNDYDNCALYTYSVNWAYPTCNTFSWVSTDTAEKTLSTTTSNSFKFVAKDKYGVILSTTALTNLGYSMGAEVTSTHPSFATVGTSSSSNLYYSTADEDDGFKITVTQKTGLKQDTLGQNEYTVTVKGKIYNTSAGTTSKYGTSSYNLKDPKYSVYYYLNGGDSLSTTGTVGFTLNNSYRYSYDVYYGETLTTQAEIDDKSTYPTIGSRTGYTFTGMYTSSTGTALMDVNEQITANKYYYAHWEKNIYTVVYLDRTNENAVYVENVEYQGEPHTAEAASHLNAIEFDASNHYVLDTANPWASISVGSLTSVEGNAFVYPNYTTTAHTMVSQGYVDATCQHKAGTLYKCSGCDYSYVQETGSTLGSHVPSDSYIVDIPATCTATGSGHYYCTVCGATTSTITIPKLPHAYNESTTNATCTQTGSIVYTCAVCGDSKTTTLPKTQHNYVAGTAVAASCTTSGYTPYTCSVCGDTYNKYDSTKPATAHNWAVNSQSEGSVTLKCSVCNATKTIAVDADLTGHDFSGATATIVTAPTCAASGTATLACKHSGCTKTITITLPALTNSHTNVTTTYTPVSGHTDGSILTKCLTCNTTIYSQTISAPSEHVYVNNGAATEPTCTANGSQPMKCVYCNSAKNETLPATGHKTVTVDATCGTAGYEKCGVCNTVIRTIDPTGSHDAEVIVNVAPTCTESGRYVSRCRICGYIMENKDESNTPALKALGHTWTDAETNDGYKTDIAPTCGVKGMEVRTCSVCGATENRDIEALEHNYVRTETPASCVTAGHIVEKCSKCGDVRTDEIVQPIGHNYGTGVHHDADCTHGAYTEYTCSVCSEGTVGHTNTVLDDGATALGHNFDETIAANVTTVAATCTTAGSKTVKCSRCDETKVTVISATGHDMKPGTAVAPTCTTAGYIPYTCNNGCGHTYNVYDAENPATGHTWGEWVITSQPTNTTDGSMTRTCTKDPSHTETVTLPKGDHTFGTTPTSETPATCYSTGTQVFKCTAHTGANACGVEITVTTAMIAHTLSTTKQNATCGANGWVKTQCTATGCTYEETTDIPATGNHTWVRDDDASTAATCTGNGIDAYKCSVCGGIKTETAEALGHDWEAGTHHVADCLNPGYTPYTCSRCSQVKNVIDEGSTALGHNFQEVAGSNTATCEVSGTVTLHCTRCDNSALDYTITVPALGHDYSVVTTAEAANCAHGKKTNYKCSRCASNYTVTADDKTSTHNYGEWTTIEAPTAESIGYKTRTCSICGKLEVETIPSTGAHHLVEISHTDAKCNATGTIEFKCDAHTDCGITDTIIIPMTATHDTELVTVPATCTTAGSAKMVCKDCSSTIGDVETIPATGHAFNNVIENVKPTCTAKGYITLQCANSGCTETTTIEIENNANEHDYQATFDVTSATCTTPELTVYSCNNCGSTKVMVTGAALGHDYSDAVTPATCTKSGYTTRTCSRCSDKFIVPGSITAALGHSYERDDPASVDATCDSTGTDVFVCTGCTESYSVVTAKKAHEYTLTQVVAATCTAAGYTVHTCENCDEAVAGHSYNDTYVAATGHTYGEGKVIKEATPGNNGVIEYKCTVCGKTYYEEYLLDASVHQWQVSVVTAATCENDGLERYTCIKADCSVCTDGNKATFTKVIPATGHAYTSSVTSAPNCTDTGIRTFTCPNTGCEHPSYTVIEPATGHTFTSQVVAPVCGHYGYTKYTCDTCGYVMNDSFTAPLTHSYDDVVTQPTCLKAGYTTHTCSKCGDVYIDNVVDPTGHNYDGGIVTTEATCTTPGVRTYTCLNVGCTEAVNGHTKTETISATGHNWGDWTTTVYPTDSAEGEKTRVCYNDSTHVETVVLPRLGHTMTAGEITVEPTCETTGTQVYFCTEHTGAAACGYTYKVTLAALGHDWDDGAYVNEGDAPTCTAEGTLTFSCKRAGCDATYTETAAKTAHEYNTVTTPANCYIDSYTTYTCKHCGYTFIITQANTKLEHVYVHTTTPATCDTDGYIKSECQLCGHTVTTPILKLNHAWGEWQTVKEATCCENGIEQRVCERNSNHVDTRTVSKTGVHTWVPTYVEANCTDPGFTNLACTGCGASIRTDYTPALGHNYDDGVYVEVTCTEEGGTLYTCQRCNHTYFEADTDPIGHVMGEWYMVPHPTVADAYAKKRDCTREKCRYFEYELGEDDSVNVYYRVDYVNDYITKDGDEGHFVAADGTTLSKETSDAYRSETLYTIYVLKDDAAVYPSKLHPTREKTLSFGAYQFTGWDLDQTDASLDAVTTNITAHAHFEGLEVYYKIVFFNADGSRLTNEQVILHGHTATYNELLGDPTMSDNIHYKFSFNYWTRTTNTAGTENSYTAIYSSGGFRAVYNATVKKYKVVYHDYNGAVLGSEVFEYGAAAANAPTGLTRPADPTYIYEFSNEWTLQNGQPYSVKSLTVPDNSYVEYDPANESNEDLTNAQKGIVDVYAKYYSKAKLYTVEVAVVDQDYNNAAGATIQLLDPAGYLVTTAKTDENGMATFRLEYRDYYTIMVSTSNGAVEDVFTLPHETTLRLKLNDIEDVTGGSKNCTCICHSFLGRFWISFLNFIYRLFGKKIVCCFDMYATHGDQLVYGE